MKLFKKEVLVEKKEIAPVDKMTQTKAIINHLERGKAITSIEAFDKYGITRLSAIIYRLRYDYGMNIVTINKEVKNRYGTKVTVAEYILKENK